MSETRPRLTKEEVDAFAEPLLAQFGLILDMDHVELRRNSEWLEGLDMEDVLRLTAAHDGRADARARRLREPVRRRAGRSR